MKKWVLLLVFLPFAAMAFSPGTGKNWPKQSGKSLYPSTILPAWKSEDQLKELAHNYLISSISDLQPTYSKASLYYFKESPYGWHLSYTQSYKDIPVYGTDVKINIGRTGRIWSVFYKTVNTSSWPQEINIPSADKEKIKAITGPAELVFTRPVIYPLENGIIPAYLVEYGNTDGSLHMEAVISTDYQLIYQEDRHMYSGEKDTTATAMVFYPDPLTSAKKPYGMPYADGNDSDILALEDERVKMDIPLSYRNDTFFLKGPYAELAEMSAPATPLAYSLNGKFDYNRHQPGFEDVNAYFHINNYQKHIKELGFKNLGSKTLRYDAHALSGNDQSEFDYFNNDLKLLFGQGGIDDAEDADVIVHEYSHFLSYDASPNNVSGSERSALEEGLCDYFACSYSRSISAYNWQKIYNWDGNETWNGRSCFTAKIYPGDLQSNRYKDAEIWTGTLMDIWGSLGRDSTDKLMLGSLYFLGKYITLSDAAHIFLQMDSITNQGKDAWGIVNHFVDHGLLPVSYKTAIQDPSKEMPFKLVSKYFSSDNLIYIEFEQPQVGSVALYDMQGRLITAQRMDHMTKVNIYTPQLAPGIYMLHIQSPAMEKSVKLIRE